MKRHARCHLVALASLTVALCAGAAAAQPPLSSNSPVVPSVEAWGAFHLAAGTGSGTLPSSWVPQVGSAPDAEGRVGQVLTLDAATGWGVECGINLFPAPSIGIQAFVSTAGTDLGGVNSPYEIELGYTYDRTSPRFCVLERVGPTTFVCPSPRFEAVPVDRDWHASVSDPAVSSLPVARDLYLNGALIRVETFATGGESGIFRIDAHGHVT